MYIPHKKIPAGLEEASGNGRSGCRHLWQAKSACVLHHPIKHLPVVTASEAFCIVESLRVRGEVVDALCAGETVPIGHATQVDGKQCWSLVVHYAIPVEDANTFDLDLRECSG